jgi:transcriptional regulator with XRE-family HTH domain
MIPREMGARVVRRRQELKLTQVELAELAGIARATLIRLESGDANVKLSTICAVAEVMHVGVGYLLGEDTVKVPSIALSRLENIAGELSAVLKDICP